MRKILFVILAVLAVAGALVSAPPAEAVSGGGSPNCHWACDCTGSPVCVCNPGTTGFCVYPPNIGCPQVYTC
jgi:hypothetical protein